MIDRRLRLIQRGGDGDGAAIIAALDDPTIRIGFPSSSPSWEHQLLGICLVDVLGRLFPRIDAVCDPVAESDRDLPPGPALLAERLQEARSHGTEPRPVGDPSIEIRIGAGTGPADLYVDGGGWQSYIGTESPKHTLGGPRVGVGPLAAACRGAAHAFQRLLSRLLPARPTPTGTYSSALTYESADAALVHPELPAAFDVRALLVGAGSVGGAAVYMLARVPGLRGELAIVDPQSLEADNLDRALLATADVVAAEEVKIDVAERALEHLKPGLNVVAEQAAIEDYVAARRRETPLPLVLSAVDTARSRRAIQDCLPLDLVNAACHPDEVTVSGHRTDEGPCVYCLHVPALLQKENILAWLISDATGIIFEQVVVRLINRVPLEPQAVRFIEQRTGLVPGALADYEGRTLEELWRERLIYGAARVDGPGGAAGAVAAPWVTALAGVLLAAEALKYSGGSVYKPYRLGPHDGAPAIQYKEGVYASPEFADLSWPARWAGSECLCRSPRRLRLLRERHALANP